MSLATGSGGVVGLGPMLAAGGQGEVYSLVTPRGLVFKRYLRRALEADPALQRRLRVMVANRPGLWREPGGGHQTLAWPLEVVRENDKFAGFLMPAVDVAATVGLHRVTNPTDRSTASGTAAWVQGFTWRYLVRTGANLARATQALHAAGVVIGDFNDSNVRVWRDARVTLLDCDSMQVRDPETAERFFCRVGRPEFTPPELAGTDWSRTVRHSSSDLFALAVHLYQLLLEGEHPFRGVWRGAGDKPAVPDLAARGTWALRAGGMLAPRPAAVPPQILPPALTALFRRAFEDGAVNPVARPTAAEWRRALEDLDGQLQQCPVSRAHVYPAGQPCPWCEHASRSAAGTFFPPGASGLAAGGAPPPGTAGGSGLAGAGVAGLGAGGSGAAGAGGAVTAGPGLAGWPLPGGAQPRPVTTRPGPGVQAHRGRGRHRRATRVRNLLIIGTVLMALTVVLTAQAVRNTAAGPAPAATLAQPGSAVVQAVAFSPGGGALAVGDLDGRISLWNASGPRLLGEVTNPQSTGVSAVAFSGDGAMMAAGDSNGSIDLWNPSTRHLIRSLAEPQGVPVSAVAFSPARSLLAAGDVGTHLWNPQTGQLIATLSDPGSGGVASALAFSPGASMLAVGDDDGSSYLWNMHTGRLAATLHDPSGKGVQAVAFSPDGRLLAAGDADGRTYVWDAATGRLAGTLRDPGHGRHDVHAVAFSPDSSMLAVGDEYGGAYLWGVRGSRLLDTITDPGYGPGNTDDVDAVAFSPGGATLAVGDVGSTATYLWNVRALPLRQRPGRAPAGTARQDKLAAPAPGGRS